MKTPQTHVGTIIEIHDGDTITVGIPLCSTRRANGDLGFHVYAEHGHVVLHCPIRLLGCNAIELAQPGGPEARDHLAGLLPTGTIITLSTVAADKFGTRWDAAVTLPDGTDLVSALIRDGWVAPWSGLGPKPTPPWPRTVTP